MTARRLQRTVISTALGALGAFGCSTGPGPTLVLTCRSDPGKRDNASLVVHVLHLRQCPNQIASTQSSRRDGSSEARWGSWGLPVEMRRNGRNGIAWALAAGTPTATQSIIDEHGLSLPGRAADYTRSWLPRATNGSTTIITTPTRVCHSQAEDAVFVWLRAVHG